MAATNPFGLTGVGTADSAFGGDQLVSQLDDAEKERRKKMLQQQQAGLSPVSAAMGGTGGLGAVSRGLFGV